MGWNMKKAYGRADEEVRRICRDINEQSNDRETLQTLVLRLQEVLSKKAPSNNHNHTCAVKVTAQRENPFDRIMIG